MRVTGSWSLLTIFGTARGVTCAFIFLENELLHVQFDLSNGVSTALGRSARLPLFRAEATFSEGFGAPSTATELVVAGLGFGGGAGLTTVAVLSRTLGGKCAIGIVVELDLWVEEMTGIEIGVCDSGGSWVDVEFCSEEGSEAVIVSFPTGIVEFPLREIAAGGATGGLTAEGSGSGGGAGLT